jgi:hemolysin III
MGSIERTYTPREELANCLTHAFGLGLALIGLVFLVTLAALRGEVRHVVACAVYGSALVLLYGASTLYHAVRSRRAKRWLRILDHSSIYVLIAGSYTPFTLITLRGGWGWSLFALVWGLAVAGVAFKVLFTGRFQRLSVGIYLVMGWLAVVALKPLVTSLPTAGLAWLGAGGLAYTAGVWFYARERMPFGHAIWHLFVIAGSACQYLSIYYSVIPPRG